MLRPVAKRGVSPAAPQVKDRTGRLPSSLCQGFRVSEGPRSEEFRLQGFCRVSILLIPNRHHSQQLEYLRLHMLNPDTLHPQVRRGRRSRGVEKQMARQSPEHSKHKYQSIPKPGILPRHVRTGWSRSASGSPRQSSDVQRRGPESSRNGFWSSCVPETRCSGSRSVFNN